MGDETHVRLRDRIWAALEGIPHPDTGRSIVAEGLVPNVAECAGRVAVSLRLEALPEARQQELAAAIERAIQALDGVCWVRIKPASATPWRPSPRSAR